MKLNGFEYGYNKSGHPEIKHNIPHVETLYKYYGISEYSVKALVNSYLYASHPFDLNDVSDSSISLLHTEVNPRLEDYQTVLKQIPFVSNESEINEIYTNDSNGKLFLEHFYLKVTSQFGIISLSNNQYSDLMWPHYTSEMGFQLEFDRVKLLRSIISRNKKSMVWLNPVNYSNERVVLNYNKIKDRPFGLAFLYMTNLKHVNWKYEEEWRIIVNNELMGVPFSKRGFSRLKDDNPVEPTNREIKYDFDCIASITLGANFLTHKYFDIKQEENLRDELILRFQTRPDSKNNNHLFEWHNQFLNFLSTQLNLKIFHSEIIKMPLKGGAILKRVKRRVYINRIEGEEYLMRFTNKVYDENGLIDLSK